MWVPKYRFKILTGKVAKMVENCVRAFSEQQSCDVLELNVQIDHVHFVVMVPPKVSISDYVGTVKGRTGIRVLNKFRHLKETPIGAIIFGRKVTVSIPWGWIQK